MIRVIMCREIAELADTDKVYQLGPIDRIQFRVHLWFCWHCRRLVRQVRWLGEVSRRHVNQLVDSDPDLEARILKKLL
jgi:hypothetical protein